MTKKQPEAEPKSEWVDPDDAPELTEEWFRAADIYYGGKLIRRGERPATATTRPSSANPKKD